MNYYFSHTRKPERLMSSVMDTYTYFLKVYVQVCVHINIFIIYQVCLFPFRCLTKVGFSIPFLKRASKEGICYRNGNPSDCTTIYNVQGEQRTDRMEWIPNLTCHSWE